MREQGQESEWILSCQRIFRLTFAVVVNDLTELERHDVVSDLVYADDLVLMSEPIEGLRNEFRQWKEAF